MCFLTRKSKPKTIKSMRARHLEIKQYGGSIGGGGDQSAKLDLIFKAGQQQLIRNDKNPVNKKMI